MDNFHLLSSHAIAVQVPEHAPEFRLLCQCSDDMWKTEYVCSKYPSPTLPLSFGLDGGPVSQRRPVNRPQAGPLLTLSVAAAPVSTDCRPAADNPESSRAMATAAPCSDSSAAAAARQGGVPAYVTWPAAAATRDP